MSVKSQQGWIDRAQMLAVAIISIFTLFMCSDLMAQNPSTAKVTVSAAVSVRLTSSGSYPGAASGDLTVHIRQQVERDDFDKSGNVSGYNKNDWRFVESISANSSNFGKTDGSARAQYSVYIWSLNADVVLGFSSTTFTMTDGLGHSLNAEMAWNNSFSSTTTSIGKSTSSQTTKTLWVRSKLGQNDTSYDPTDSSYFENTSNAVVTVTISPP